MGRLRRTRCINIKEIIISKRIQEIPEPPSIIRHYPPTQVTQSWADILDAPTFIINLNSYPERFERSRDRIENAGFLNILRFEAIDGRPRDNHLDEYWALLDSPPIYKDGFSSNQQACALSHFLLWSKMIRENIPLMNVFEDDIKFHEKWSSLSQDYYNETPKDFHILFLGSQMSNVPDRRIVCQPSFCLHAYTISLDGAKLLLDLCARNINLGGLWDNKIFVIDCMLIEYMHRNQFQWYNWNGTLYYDSYYKNMESGNQKERNAGLVFQDDSLESTMHIHIE